ncbi:MAG TPA: ATP synthase subunit I [Terriglobales bacterium]|nr:ATP synthase subunit I [Terriglobales bacterium]
MTEDFNPPPPSLNAANIHAEDPDAQRFYVQAHTRIVRSMLAVALLAAAVFFWRPGWRFASSFLLGCALAFLNFRGLEKLIAGLSDFIVKNPDRPPSGRVVRRFLLRYVLIAVGAYVIFKGLGTAVYGFFAGLFLPVVGILYEAVYELFTSLKSQS